MVYMKCRFRGSLREIAGLNAGHNPTFLLVEVSWAGFRESKFNSVLGSFPTWEIGDQSFTNIIEGRLYIIIFNNGK